jgi:hypothetical protein
VCLFALHLFSARCSPRSTSRKPRFTRLRAALRSALPSLHYPLSTIHSPSSFLSPLLYPTNHSLSSMAPPTKPSKQPRRRSPRRKRGYAT